ncbi:MAG TPA: RtcB family protein [Armatimonadota bacterium]|mgnify:FL=1|nr:RtcB family protein [Armatimonadota bacterium]HPO71443.1 RtcB family protein [Armatimonadota bacterium]
MITQQDLKEIERYVYEIPREFRADMRVPARVYASPELMKKIFSDRSLEQLINTATLPGVEKYVIAMPDIHQGYGCPVGGVVATRADDGIISPGVTGYDINCGVRLLATTTEARAVRKRISTLVDLLFTHIPSGVGGRGPIHLSEGDMAAVLEQGAAWAVKRGYGAKEDLARIEEGGSARDAQAEAITDKARQRGRDELGTLGSGNHFVEVQRVERILNPDEAERMGVFEDQLCFMIHSGSRGLGHQTCTDYVNICRRAMPQYGIQIPDQELACVPYQSPEGQAYYHAMRAATNFAFANRQVLSHSVREAWDRAMAGVVKDREVRTIWEVGHNVATLFQHEGKELVVHRKGAARTEPGKPLLIPGSMGSASYLLVGTEKAERETFGTCAHGAGRVMSRAQAKKRVQGQELRQQLEEQGVLARTKSYSGLAEEAPFAYKDVDAVIRVVEATGLARPVARLVPLAVVKG